MRLSCFCDSAVDFESDDDESAGGLDLLKMTLECRTGKVISTTPLYFNDSTRFATNFSINAVFKFVTKRSRMMLEETCEHRGHNIGLGANLPVFLAGGETFNPVSQRLFTRQSRSLKDGPICWVDVQFGRY